MEPSNHIATKAWDVSTLTCLRSHHLAVAFHGDCDNRRNEINVNETLVRMPSGALRKPSPQQKIYEVRDFTLAS